MYTGLKVRCVVKPEFSEIIEKLNNDDHYYRWEELARDYPQYGWLTKWASVDRAVFIPFGAVCYLHDPWTEGYSNYNKEDRIWDFECSLKNYENEIETFLKTVLATIAKDILICYSQYEEDEQPTYYTMEDILNG